MFKKSLFISVCLLLAFFALAGKETKEIIKKKDIPKEVLEAIDKKIQRYEFTKILLQTKNGIKEYKIYAKNKKKKVKIIVKTQLNEKGVISILKIKIKENIHEEKEEEDFGC